MNSRTAIQLFKIISRLPVAGLQTWDWGADLNKLRDQAQCFECAFLFFWPWRRPARPRAVSAAASANPPAIRLPKRCQTRNMGFGSLGQSLFLCCFITQHLGTIHSHSFMN